MSIYNYIIHNFENCSIEELRNSIEDSVLSNEEEVLPGLGVMFNILWKNSDNKDQILNILFNNIKK